MGIIQSMGIIIQSMGTMQSMGIIRNKGIMLTNNKWGNTVWNLEKFG